MSSIDTLRTALFGNPPSADYKPSRDGVILAFVEFLRTLDILAGGIAADAAGPVYATVAELNADLGHPSGAIGMVYNDPDPDTSGIYIKTGSSGSGSWLETGLLGRGAPASDEQILTALSYYTENLDSAATAVQTAASNAVVAADTSTAARDTILAAIAAANIPGFDTRAEMIAGLAGVPLNDTMRVLRDETRNNTTQYYQKTGSSTVAYLDIAERVNRLAMAPITGTGAYVIDQAAETGLTSSDGRDMGMSLSISKTLTNWTNGPPGEVNYVDTVIAILFNGNANSTPRNLDMPMARIAIESAYAQGAGGEPLMVEFHIMSAVPSPNYHPGMGEYRMLSGTWMHDPANYEHPNNQVSTRAAQNIFYDGRNQPRVQYKFFGASATISFAGRTAGNDPDGIPYVASGHPILQFGDNNRPVIQQINAAGNAFITMLQLNAMDQMVTERPTFHSSPSIVGSLGFRSVHEGIDTSGAAGSMYSYRLVNGTVAGAYTFDRVAGATTGQLSGKYVYQVGTGQAVGNIVEHAGAGDALGGILRAEGSADFGWSYGMRGSDGAYVLANSKTGSLASRVAIAVPVGANPVPVLPNLPARAFADDAAAATGGVPVGGLYHNAGAVRVRLA